MKILRGSRQHRGTLRQWIEDHPRIARVLERSGSFHADEFALARGVSLGLFVGLTPTVGIQTVMMIAGSLTFRANFPAAMIVSLVSNPFTVAPLYYGFHQLGRGLAQRLPAWREVDERLTPGLAADTTALLIGSMAVAIPSAVIGYFGFLALWRALDLRLPIGKRRE